MSTRSIRATLEGPPPTAWTKIALESGDLLAIMSAGAYGAVQSGTYNSRLLVPEVLVNGTQAAIVRPRTTYDDLIGLDTIPAWLA